MSTRPAETCTVQAPTARRPAPIPMLAWLQKALALRRQRLQLARMDAAQLRDIGLTAEQARAEAKRPVWDVPAHWLR